MISNTQYQSAYKIIRLDLTADSPWRTSYAVADPSNTYNYCDVDVPDVINNNKKQYLHAFMAARNAGNTPSSSKPLYVSEPGKITVAVFDTEVVNLGITTDLYLLIVDLVQLTHQS